MSELLEARAGASVARTYESKTPSSHAAIERARAVMPSGSTRSFSYFRPYPVVFERGLGPHLWDVDGNRYIDFANNGLSLIHGNAYGPIQEAVREASPNGSAWPGTSRPQIEFAELLCDRIAVAERVRFVNTGTEATMLAIKLARHATGRPLVLKAWHGYHGFSEDLSAGIEGNGEIPGRVLLAEFGNAESFRERIEAHGDDIAAVIVEPVPYTGRVTPPPDGFLKQVEELARSAGAISIIDDCLMFRLAPGGSSERFGLDPDLVCLGKWIGGGYPVGAIGGGAELLDAFDHSRANAVYHGGSFNGNPIGTTAGRIAVEDLTGERIETMEDLAVKLVAGLQASAESHRVPLSVRGLGSAFGVYVLDSAGEVDTALSSLLHLAGVNEGVYLGPGGEMAMSTAMTDEVIEDALTGFDAALAAVRPAIEE
jgi:glutamate-1-semialdehyde 2,1-aminomutase